MIGSIRRFSVLLFAISAFAILLTGCGGATRTTTTTPATPPPSTVQPYGAQPIGFLRVASLPASITQQPLNEARIQTRMEHLAVRQSPIAAPRLADMYLLPFIPGWWYEEPRKITSTPGAYTSVHVSIGGPTLVFSSVVNGYNQVFVSTIPKQGEMLAPIQLTTDLEHHWVPHLSYDGSKVVYTKFDTASSGDVVCTMAVSAPATEKCLDFSSTQPTLRGANLWHANWLSSESIIFEAWGGSLASDELFTVLADGSNLAQLTKNAGTPYHFESPSVGGEWYLGVARCDVHGSCDVATMDPTSGKADLFAPGGYDPLCSQYTVLWINSSGGGGNLFLDRGWDSVILTRGGYGDYFEGGYRDVLWKR